MVQNILLATDGSTCAERAVDFTAYLSHCSPKHIIVVHAFVQAPSKWEASLSGHPDFETEAQAQLLVDLAVKRLRNLGIEETTALVSEGPAVPVILGAADIYHPELLVIGARGQSLWPGTCLGSVSMAIAQRSNCPVLIIK